ncbi:MAG: hypothetical protein SOR72_07465, partial [Hornefia sp.]|nr:hypothetical protein [Hornefia sp.]
WQVIYVFDNNKDTNVVCEGYSKAFQYLCDLSQFDDKTLLCSSVSGDIMSDSGSGPHMWNTVKIGKKAYHVDLTNMDTESAPKHNELFLNGVNGSVEKGYRFSWNKSYIYYSYDNLTRHVFPQDILSLSAGSYYKDMKKPSENKKHAKIKVGSVKRLTVRKRQGKRLLQWEKAKNAGEYRVAYKTVGAKKWTYITTKSRKIAIKKLSKYKKYCFKVRAVKRVNKKISCGKWTAIKKN